MFIEQHSKFSQPNVAEGIILWVTLVHGQGVYGVYVCYRKELLEPQLQQLNWTELGQSTI